MNKEVHMPRPRRTLVSIEDTPYYHCISRCVRRAFLCGKDRATGRSYDHRKAWLVERFKLLSELFAVDICAYAVMSNHYHLVVRIDPDRAGEWTVAEVVERWCGLFKCPRLIERYQAGPVSKAEKDAALEMIATWRARLAEISWFMRCLNEPIARQANAEDRCTGRFWEGRFKSQALLDEAALLTCMTYVDLNPIRAGLAENPEDSDFTSIQARIETYAGVGEEAARPRLLPFVGGERMGRPDGIGFAYSDYLELVDWTGRAIRDDKRGHISGHLAPILQRLNINPDAWLPSVRYYNRRFKCVLGPVERIRRFSLSVGRRWLQGLAASRRLYCPSTT